MILLFLVYTVIISLILDGTEETSFLGVTKTVLLHQMSLTNTVKVRKLIFYSASGEEFQILGWRDT